jgi:hypothetical protein
MRLIVLSKTHAWGQKCAPEVRTPSRAHTCASFNLPDNDVLLRSALQTPCTPWGERQRRTDPSIYDVIRRRQAWSPERKLVFRDRAVMVEPDGIEPTTSCLQSTRSTN